MALETLRSSCTHLDGRRLWLGKVALRSRLVALSGWRGARRYSESIPLGKVEFVERLNDRPSGNLVLQMKDGTERVLRVSAPGIWRMQIEYRLRRIAVAEGEAIKPVARLKVDPSLPTADQVETELAPAIAEIEDDATEELEELAVWPRFESEEATIEIVDETEHEFLIEPVAVADDGTLVPDPTSEEEEVEPEPEPESEPEEVVLVDELSFDAVEEEVEEVVEEEAEAVVEAEVEVEVEVEAEAIIEAPAAMDLPNAADLSEIGDDVVFDVAMDASTHGDVVLDWLEPLDVESRSESEVEAPEVTLEVDVPDADLEVEAPEVTLETPQVSLEVESPDVDLEIEPPEVELALEAPDVSLEVDVPPPEESPDVLEIELAQIDDEVPIARLTVEPADLAVAESEQGGEEPSDKPTESAALPIASRPFDLTRLYESMGESGTEAAPAPELAPEAAPEPAPEAEPAPAISTEPATRKDRRRMRAMAELRPMSLAELIREAEPRWTPLAELD